MTSTPTSHTVALKHLLGVRFGTGFPCLGTRAGRPGEGGGETIKWLKLNLEEVEDRGPLSKGVKGAGLKLIRGDFRDEMIISPCV